MKSKIFEGWVFDRLALGFHPCFAKLLFIDFSFMKLKGHPNQRLNQELWRLKDRPESFVQKVPARAKSKLILRQYDEKYFFEPSPYSRYKFFTEAPDGSDKLYYEGGKELKISFFKALPLSVELSEKYSGYKYKFEPDVFNFQFTHPLSGKDTTDKLYQVTKDEYCGSGYISSVSVRSEYTGKFCPDRRKFTYRELLPYILQSMHRQFDFVEEDGKRMEWYEELLSEIKQPMHYLNEDSLEDFNDFCLSRFYQASYRNSLAIWEAQKMDHLLGEEEKEEVPKAK